MFKRTLLTLSFAGCASMVATADIPLGVAEDFAVLAASTVTNTGPTVIDGSLGVSPGTAVTGFPPGQVVNGTIHVNDGVAVQAQADALVAYNVLAGLAPTADLTGVDLGGMTLTPGVYFFASSAGLTGQLTLDGQGETNPLFVFQIGSTLTTATASSVVLTNGADACKVFFQVGSSATLGTATQFAGTIIAQASNTLTTGTTVDGRVIALTGAVTLDANLVSTPESCSVGELHCVDTACPCGNTDPSAGCANSTGSGGLLLASGSASISANDLTMTATGLPPNTHAVLVASNGLANPPFGRLFGDGIRCVGGGEAGDLNRVFTGMSDADGNFVVGPGVLGLKAGAMAGQTRYYQVIYRDPAGPCGSGFNATNAVEITYQL